MQSQFLTQILAATLRTVLLAAGTPDERASFKRSRTRNIWGRAFRVLVAVEVAARHPRALLPKS